MFVFNRSFPALPPRGLAFLSHLPRIRLPRSRLSSKSVEFRAEIGSLRPESIRSDCPCHHTP